ncbi:hypothetical protein [Sphingomonas elodea]|uniref:hypothetical protein n=1 Tax=Sphingomonas elodea TaxID=179878 RepID=UPI0002EF9654|nr:hypothetical protein [Sphingomonas elodea]
MPEADLLARANGLLESPMVVGDWPLGFYSRERLFSVAARRGFVEPGLAPLP